MRVPCAARSGTRAPVVPFPRHTWTDPRFPAGVASYIGLTRRGHDAGAHLPRYPPTKRIGSQEIHRRRVEHVRSAGPHTQGYLARLREGPWVFGDQIARLDRLASSFGLAALEKACARAQHFGALDGATRVEKILERGLHELALDAHHASTSRVEHDFGRKLAEYDALLVERKVAS
jgi:hypothetical protein